VDELLIRQEIQDRGISRLCHLTRSQKALHILSSEEGVKAVDFLDHSLYDANDPLRLDGRTGHVNCSVEYPNHWYWNRVKDKEPLFRDWVTLLINPEILTLENTELCPFNAATGYGAHISKGYLAFQSLFAAQVRGRNRTPRMLPCCPTDDQAEVLVYKNISRKDIIGIVVMDEDQAESETLRWSQCKIPNFDIFIAPDLFNGRWSSKVRQGERPYEFKYGGGD
jgi:hypothetical protein